MAQPQASCPRHLLARTIGRCSRVGDGVCFAMSSALPEVFRLCLVRTKLIGTHGVCWDLVESLMVGRSAGKRQLSQEAEVSEAEPRS